MVDNLQVFPMQYFVSDFEIFQEIAQKQTWAYQGSPLESSPVGNSYLRLNVIIAVLLPSFTPWKLLEF